MKYLIFETHTNTNKWALLFNVDFDTYRDGTWTLGLSFLCFHLEIYKQLMR